VTRTPKEKKKKKKFKKPPFFILFASKKIETKNQKSGVIVDPN